MHVESNEPSPSLSIISIATDRYLVFWQDMINSFYVNSEFFPDCQWVLLTDRERDIDPKVRAILGENLTVAYIPHSKWPLPTLLRYKYLTSFRNLISGARILYIDADMKVISNISRNQILNFFDSDLMTFVNHPGYFRQSFFLNPLNARRIAKDLLLRIKYGGIGNWETSKKSQAYVQRRLRKNYFCGGIWGGPTEEVLKFADLLNQRTDIDIQNGVMAKFHDESHLNWFAANHKCKLQLPTWCFDPSYSNLRGLKPFVEAVNKNSAESWKR